MTRTTGCSACQPGKTRVSAWPSSATGGFIVFTVDDDAGLVRVYGLVWIG